MGKVSKSILVIVMGLPGSGKSFFAKNLAKENPEKLKELEILLEKISADGRSRN